MRPLPRGLKWQSGQLRAISDVLATDHARNMTILFRRVTNPFADFPAFTPDFSTEKFGRAGSDRLQLQKAFHEGAFARAVWPEQPDGTWENLQSDVIQSALLAK